VKVKELFESNIIRPPANAAEFASDLYDSIQENIALLKTILEGDPTQTLKLSKLRPGKTGFDRLGKFASFKVKRPWSKRQEKLSVLLYWDEEDEKVAALNSRDEVLINVGRLGAKHQFTNAFEHELVHAVDPKTSFVSPEELKRLETVPHEEYVLDPGEFDAYSSALLLGIERQLKGRPEAEQAQFKKDLLSFLNSLSERDAFEVVETDKKFNAKFKAVWPDWKDDARYLIAAWQTDERLYRKFLKRVNSTIFN
jgi:hypothetical protein